MEIKTFVCESCNEITTHGEGSIKGWCITCSNAKHETEMKNKENYLRKLIKEEKGFVRKRKRNGKTYYDFVRRFKKRDGTRELKVIRSFGTDIPELYKKSKRYVLRQLGISPKIKPKPKKKTKFKPITDQERKRLGMMRKIRGIPKEKRTFKQILWFAKAEKWWDERKLSVEEVQNAKKT